MIVNWDQINSFYTICFVCDLKGYDVISLGNFMNIPKKFIYEVVMSGAL